MRDAARNGSSPGGDLRPERDSGQAKMVVNQGWGADARWVASTEPLRETRQTRKPRVLPFDLSRACLYAEVVLSVRGNGPRWRRGLLPFSVDRLGKSGGYGANQLVARDSSQTALRDSIRFCMDESHLGHRNIATGWH